MLLVVLGLTACSDDEEPPSTLPPVSASPSETAAAGEVPEEAQEATREGAAEFGRFFYETVEASFQDLDTKALRAISDPSCEVCQRYIDSIDGFAKAGQRVEGNDITIIDVVAAPVEGATASATVIYNSTAGRVVDGSGRVVLEEAARTNVVADMVLRRDGDSWVVTEVSAQ
ncbi:MAG: DUF6318 family protein [Actinomycetes bacterium]